MSFQGCLPIGCRPVNAWTPATARPAESLRGQPQSRHCRRVRPARPAAAGAQRPRQAARWCWRTTEPLDETRTSF